MNQKIYEYLESTNKALASDIKTKAISNAPDTQVSSVRLAIIEGSAAMQAFNTMPVVGNETEVPVLNLPNSTDTDFIVDGITVTRSNIYTTSTITDETTEDSVPDLREALDTIVASQSILKLESAIATQLNSLTAETGSRTKSFSSIINGIQEFPDQTKRILGRWYVFVSTNTHLDIFSGLTTVQLALMERIGIDLIPVYGLANNAMVVAHSHGVAGGLLLRSVEEDREGGSQEAVLVSSASVAAGIDPNYAKRFTLA